MKITPPDFGFRGPLGVESGDSSGGGDVSGPPPVVTGIGGVPIDGDVTDEAMLIYQSWSNTWQISTRRWEVLMTDGVTSPPEAVYSEDGTDWLYGLYE